MGDDMIDRAVLVARLAAGFRADGWHADAAEAAAERMLGLYDKIAICNRCGSSIEVRQDSRHLMPDPVSLHGRDH